MKSPKSQKLSAKNEEGEAGEGASPAKIPRMKEGVIERASQRSSQSQLAQRPVALPWNPPWRKVPIKQANRAERPPDEARITEGRIAASRSTQGASRVAGAQRGRNSCNSAEVLRMLHSPVGMLNGDRNLCYANSSIQMLFYCTWSALHSCTSSVLKRVDY